MATMTTNSGDRAREKAPGDVLALLRDQAALYARLESIAERQRTLVTRDDTTPLLVLLADRQRLSRTLSDVGRQLAPIRGEWSTYREQLDAAQQQEADRLVEEIADRLKRVIEGDERDARLLSARREMTSRALRTMHAGTPVRTAYLARAATGDAPQLDEAS